MVSLWGVCWVAVGKLLVVTILSNCSVVVGCWVVVRRLAGVCWVMVGCRLGRCLVTVAWLLAALW